MTAATHKSGELEIVGDLSDIGRDDDSPEIAAATIAPPVQSNGVLSRVAAYYAGRCLTPGAWGQLFGSNFESIVAAAVDRHELSPTFKTGVGLLGVGSSALADWAEKRGIHPAETPVTRILNTITFDEVFPIVPGQDSVITAAHAAKKLGIDEGVILTAIKSGAIGNEGGKAFATKWRIDHAGLRAWLEASGTVPKWHPDIVAQVARQRGVAEDNERERLEAQALAAGKPMTVTAADAALRLVEQSRTEDAQHQQTIRNHLLSQYRQILRRDEPADDDAEVLEDIMREFGWSGDRIRNDTEILKRAADCQVRMADVEAKNSELLAAVKAEADMKKRHKQEVLDAATRISKAREKCNDIRKADSELTDLRNLRPEIFGDD